MLHLYIEAHSSSFLDFVDSMKKKVEFIGLFICLIIIFYLISSSALESPEASLQQKEEQQNIQEETPLTSDQENLTIEEEIAQPITLAQIVHGQSLDSDQYIQDYLQQHDYFEDLDYKEVVDSTPLDLEADNAIAEDIQGIALDNQGYAIHLVICDEETQSCYFRINGVPTGKFVAKDDISSDGIKSFDINDQYTLEINKIIFNDSGDKRFYDIYWDKRNIVELTVINKAADVREVD